MSYLSVIMIVWSPRDAVDDLSLSESNRRDEGRARGNMDTRWWVRGEGPSCDSERARSSMAWLLVSHLDTWRDDRRERERERDAASVWEDFFTCGWNVFVNTVI